jgi:hypothetical protein
VYWSAFRETDKKIQVQEVELFCELEDPQGLGLSPFSAQDPNPFPRPLNLPQEYKEAVLAELTRLGAEAIEKNDWSGVFTFITVRVPNWRGSTRTETDNTK